MLLLYDVFLFIYQAALRIVSFFNGKAKKWLNGRKDIFRKMEATLRRDEKRIWIHCASVGEFEQARPLIEKIKNQKSEIKIVLTFFSPSGYELHENYEYADYVFYLPLDGRKNSGKFLRLVNPSLAFFVKYEFWYYYIRAMHARNVPLVLISGAFREEQPFFKWYGALFRNMLRKFSFFFLQDEHSQTLLKRIGIEENAFVTGDTRYDRVMEIAQQAQIFPQIESWKGKSKLLIAGSTWPDDETVLKACLPALPADWKLILAPHEIDKNHLTQIKKLFGNQAVFYSELNERKTAHATENVLVIDNIGMLSSVFRYGEIAYIGGGFQKGGIHNTLEPAVFGLPVIFGPVYKKFVEAKELVENGFAFRVKNSEECKEVLYELIHNEKTRHDKREALKKFVQSQVGATEKIINTLHDRFL